MPIPTNLDLNALSYNGTPIPISPRSAEKEWNDRPYGAPNLDKIDLTGFYGAYVTLDIATMKTHILDGEDIHDFAAFSIFPFNTNYINIDRGHISGTSFVVDENIYTNVTGPQFVYPNSSWDDYTVLRISVASGLFELNGSSSWIGATASELEGIFKFDSTSASRSMSYGAIVGAYKRLKIIGANNKYTYSNCIVPELKQLEIIDCDFSSNTNYGLSQFYVQGKLQSLIVRNTSLSGLSTAELFDGNQGNLREVTFDNVILPNRNYSLKNIFNEGRPKTGVVDLSKYANSYVTSFQNAFASSKSVRKIICKNINFENCTYVGNMIYYNSLLEEINFAGCHWPALTTGFGNITVYNGAALCRYMRLGEIFLSVQFDNMTLLTHDNLVEILNDLGTVETTQTINMGATNLAKLSAAEIAIATAKGWTVT